MMKKDINLSLADEADLKPHLRDAESILGSQDLGLLKLASPELERLIIQSNGMVVTTTPTSPQFLYPKTVTDEQEFAEGFVKALEDLHKQNQLSGAAGQRDGNLDLGADIAPVAVQPDLPVYTNLHSYGSGPLESAVNYSTDTVPFPSHHLGAAAPQPQLSRVQPLKEEPQTVPDVQSFGRARRCLPSTSTRRST